MAVFNPSAAYFVILIFDTNTNISIPDNDTNANDQRRLAASAIYPIIGGPNRNPK